MNADNAPIAGEAGLYEIRIKGHLDSRWVNRFGDVTITLEDSGNTLITGQVVDQAALYGLLKKLRDVGLPLLALQQVKPGASTVR